jgi:hypothetical protein
MSSSGKLHKKCRRWAWRGMRLCLYINLLQHRYIRVETFSVLQSFYSVVKKNKEWNRDDISDLYVHSASIMFISRLDHRHPECLPSWESNFMTASRHFRPAPSVHRTRIIANHICHKFVNLNSCFLVFEQATVCKSPFLFPTCQLYLLCP